MSECGLVTFCDIPTDVLAYLALFLSFRDRTALALTCVGFWTALSDRRVPGLMLGGLRTRLVDTLVQFEEWETLAKIMPGDYEHIEAAVTRSIWKGSTVLGSVYPDMVGDKERALALLRGYGHVLELFPMRIGAVVRACKMLNQYSIEVCDLALGIFVEYADRLPDHYIWVIMNVAASTRTQGEMEDVIGLILPHVSGADVKHWCYERGWVALGNRLFPDIFVCGVLNPVEIALCQFYASESVEHILETMYEEPLNDDLERRTLANTPKHIMDRFLRPGHPRRGPFTHNGLMRIKQLCYRTYRDDSGILTQQIVDEAQGLDLDDLKNVKYELPPFFPPGVDLDDVCKMDKYKFKEKILPALDMYRYQRDVRVLQQQDLPHYCNMVCLESPIIQDRKVYTIMLEKLRELNGSGVYQEHFDALTKVAFAQGRVDEFRAAKGPFYLGEWEYETEEPWAAWMWCRTRRQISQGNPDANKAMLQALPLKYYQKALNMWLPPVEWPDPFEWLCVVDPKDTKIADLDFSGLERMLYEMDLDMAMLGSDALGNGCVREKILATATKMMSDPETAARGARITNYVLATNS